MDIYQLSHIQHIQQSQREGRLAIFVGAGVSRNSGIPTWDELIKAMKQELPKALVNDTDSLKIAQLYKDARGYKEYMDKVKEVLLYNKSVPNDLHKKILSLNPCQIITTNYDDLLEQEIKAEFALFDVVHQDSDIPHMSYPNALIKMHGDYSSENIVLTENDYYNYAQNFPLIRALVQSIFASKLVLFVGFSFADLNLKMIMNELKNILSENMQRAYLVSIDRPDELTTKYFENKGINIIYLEEKDVKKLAGKDYKFNIKDNKGITLENVLSAICSDKDLLEKDLASYLYARVKSYQSQIRSFGDGLRYLFPDYKEIIWNTHSEGLQTFSPYFKELKNKLLSNPDKRKFLIEHPDIDLRTLLVMAYYNYLPEIDGVEILDNKFNENVDSYIEATTIDYVRNFDYKEALDRIKKLHSRSIDYTIMDLEYPFFLYYVGRYWEAYTIYSTLLSKYWDRQKYILYFLCRYNMWAIRNGVRNQRIFDEEFDSKKDLQLADEDLDVILSKLPLQEEMRRLLGDVISYRQIGNRLLKSDKLREDIYAQRVSAMKGGCSINSNIANLLAHHKRESQFCYSNFIISNNSNQYSSLCYNVVMSILNSLSTKTGYFMGGKIEATKLTHLSVFLLKVLLFEIHSKELSTIIEAYEITDIEITKDGIEFLNRGIKTLLDSKENPYAKDNQIVDLLSNFLTIILVSKEYSFDTDSLYSLLINYWRHESSFSKKLRMLIYKYNPSTEIAKQLLNNMLYESRSISVYHESISLLVNLLSKENVSYENICLDDFKRNEEVAALCILYPIAPVDMKEYISAYCINNMKNLSNYLFFIRYNDVKIEDTSQFTDLLKKEKSLSENECELMCAIRNNEKYKILHELIDEYGKVDKCLRFFLSPEDYPYPEDFEAHWALTHYRTDEERVNFFKKEQYRNKLKNLINDEYWNDENRKYLISLL